MARLLSVLVLALFSSGCAMGFRAEARGSNVPADDGYPLRVYQMRESGGSSAPAAARGVVFYVDGSRRTSVLDRMGALAGFCMLGFSVILVEPRGLADDGGFDRALAWRSDTKARRVSDERSVVDAILAGRRPNTVLLFGVSEGGDVAARVAAEDARITHTILLGSGGGISQANELGLLLKRQPGYLGLGSEAELDGAFERIRRQPEALTEWLGHPYRRWSSYLWSRPLDDLMRGKSRVLALHGSDDMNVPVESARELDTAMKDTGRLSYVEYPGVDHRFRQTRGGKSVFPCVELDVVAWLARTSVLSEQEARAFSERTRGAHPEWFSGGEQRCAM
ncbi:MAG: alpha/beta hydrolase [Myxococcales bacterium]|nr:alpha/beta hydrolase [Myxococcales bacterium]